jgi:hypothetical protein
MYVIPFFQEDSVPQANFGSTTPTSFHVQLLIHPPPRDKAHKQILNSKRPFAWQAHLFFVLESSNANSGTSPECHVPITEYGEYCFEQKHFKWCLTHECPTNTDNKRYKRAVHEGRSCELVTGLDGPTMDGQWKFYQVRQ